MTANLKNSTPEAQISQPLNSSPVSIDFVNGLTPIASLIVLGIVGKLFVDSLCRLVEAIKEK